MKNDSSLINNYAEPPFNAVKGEGVYLYDENGKSYLDFTSGIAVNSLGHSHPVLIKALKNQMNELIHCSNLFGILSQKKLAKKLVDITGPGKVYFCNSGAEANESLIKLARLFGVKNNKKTLDIITAKNSFHGRSFGCMAATEQEKIKKGFYPHLEGFVHAELNNISDFEKLINNGASAVMIETIQGEGGVFPAHKEFLIDLRKLCTEKKCLLILDEVQCGVGRTGKFYAYEESGIVPDAIGLAKGLGAGFPIGAIWVADSFSDLFQPGSHGSTFGGNPLASTAANTVIDIIEENKLLANVCNLSKNWLMQLNSLKDKYPDKIKEIRGRGFMIGISVNDSKKVVESSRDHGLLVVPASHNTVRVLPPLISNENDLNKSISILDSVLSNI